MIQSDDLSRRPNLNSDDEEPELVTMLPQTLFVNLIDLDLQAQILDSRQMDEEADKALKLLLEEGPTNLKKDLSKWSLQTKEGKRMLFFQNRAYIPENMELR